MIEIILSILIFLNQNIIAKIVSIFFNIIFIKTINIKLENNNSPIRAIAWFE